MINIDNTYLKYKYCRVFFVAIIINVESIVNAKSNDNWLWFLQKLKTTILTSSPLNSKLLKFTFLFDHQKGLIDAINIPFPTCKHTFYFNIKFLKIYTLFEEAIEYLMSIGLQY
uniref:MULE transposase domain-containing protein n=1 Tax=Physcomitrium patens TaxID=3218 RepID=A0A2K1JQL9_PHYPA|nr:hypothetical protein PHYPA_016214 [Physcomitrium patens]